MSQARKKEQSASHELPYAFAVMELQREISGDSPTKKPHRRPLALLIEFSIVLGLGVSLALCLHVFVTQVYAISGQSMEPTLQDGERVVISKLSPTLVDLSHGDVVIFESPSEPRKCLIKRVIGLPGDRVEYRDGTVYLNGLPIEEDYARREIRGFASGVPASVVPVGQVFVMGDNRPQSQDSRDFGAVSMELIKGKVFLKLWPLDSLEFFP